MGICISTTAHRGIRRIPEDKILTEGQVADIETDKGIFKRK